MKKFFKEYKKIIFLFVFWVIIINLFAILGLNRFQVIPDTAYNWINPNEFFSEQTWNLSNIHAHWDSTWYLDIAKNGYSFKDLTSISNIVFFPTYPFLIKIFSYLFAGNLLFSGWFVSLISLQLMLIVFYKYTKEFHKKIKPILPLFFLLCFPTAFFFNSIYTESLFLLFTILTFYFTLKKKYWLAGLFGFISSLTRVTGVLLFIPILWEYLSENKFKIKKIFKKELLSIFLIPAGLFSFLLFHYIKFGDALLFLKVESWFGREFKLNAEHFDLFSRAATTNFIFDISFLGFGLIATILVFKKLRVSYGLYMLANIAIAVSTGTLMSIGRYISILFPIFLLAASIKSKNKQLAWMFFSTLLLALYTLAFVNNYWAG